MTPDVDPSRRSPDPRPEAERQVASAIERHREVLASMQSRGGPETAQHVAVKAVGRALALVSFALRSATEAGVPLDRLVELTGWEPELVSEAVARAPDPRRPPARNFVAQLAPAGLDPSAVAQAAASAEATARLQELTQHILTDIDARSQAPADLVDLYERLDREWRSWRDVRTVPGTGSTSAPGG
jgi:hypothetical protein